MKKTIFFLFLLLFAAPDLSALVTISRIEISGNSRTDSSIIRNYLYFRETDEMSLQELRQQVSGITQTELAELMEVTQGAISQLESRHDVLLSKLAEYVHALGGDLELVARFPEADVRITQFDPDDELATAAGE